MNKTRKWLSCLLGCLLPTLVAPTVAYSQDAATRGIQSTVPGPPLAVERSSGPVIAVPLQNIPAPPPAIQLGSDKIATVNTVPGWQSAMGTTDVVLSRDGACLVTCNLDVQSHVLTGYLIFRTSRRNVSEGTNESDDGWAMDVPVPISQGSASATYAWPMKGGQVYRFGCRMLPDRGFVGIPVYPNVSWVCG